MKMAGAAAPAPSFPESFYCPITADLMRDPVMDPEGNSYERSAVEDWLSRSPTSPVTRAPLAAHQLAPNRALKSLIEAALAAPQPSAPTSSALRTHAQPESQRWRDASLLGDASTASRVRSSRGLRSTDRAGKSIAMARRSPGPPGPGYVCMFCGAEGGTPGAHWHQSCPRGPARPALAQATDLAKESCEHAAESWYAALLCDPRAQFC
eukprot:COSAG04_NODE_2012_length_5004_cov_3.098063_2_plen_209_part_00